MKTKSNLARVLDSGQFAVTAEVSPPQNTELDTIRKNVDLIKGYVDAFNVPDGQAAVVAMASWAVCLVGMQEGLDAVVQMTCRDRNRIALQMDILAISAFGVDNILCLSGDPIHFGNHPKAKPVFDLDSVQLIGLVRQLRDEKKFDNGELIVGEGPRFFIGAATNPFARQAELKPAVDRLEEKVAAGADFVQTQPIYNIEAFEKWMGAVRERGLDKQTRILAGITPVLSLAAARYMKTKIPNMDIPDKIIGRLKDARNKEEAAEEGIRIAVETINQLKKIKGVAGVHIMTLQREELIPRICTAAGLHPRP
jgi:methylenetetrahydrofolate reductase (NADH)